VSIESVNYIKNKFNTFNFFIILLIIINLLIRLHFSFEIRWFNDDSRDFLVARNIIFDHDYQWIAPYASWGENHLKNSVFYYYFLVIFVFFSLGNPIFLRLLFLLFFFSSLLIFSYLLSKLFFLNKKNQLLTILFFIYFPSFYSSGSYTFQPNFTIPFLLSFIYYFFYAYKNRSIKYLTIALLLYSIATHIHYANLMLLPWVIIFTVYMQYKFYRAKKKNSKVKRIFFSQINYPNLILFLNFIFIFLNQIMNVNASSRKPSLTFIFEELFLNNKNYFAHFYSNIKFFFSSFMGDDLFFKLLYLMLTLLILAFFFLRKKIFYSISSFFALLFFLPMFSLMNELTYEFWYFYPIYAFLLIFFITVISSLEDKLSSTILCFFLLFFLASSGLILKNHLIAKDFNKHEFVANVISRDLEINKKHVKDFFIFSANDCNNDENAVYWMYLELALKKRLVKNDPFENAYFIYSSVFDHSDNIYLICDDANVKHELPREDWCFNEFGLKDMVKKYQLIYSSNEKNLSIYYLLLMEEIHKYDMAWYFAQ